MPVRGPRYSRFVLPFLVSMLVFCSGVFGGGGLRPGSTGVLPDAAVGQRYSGGIADLSQALPAVVVQHRRPFAFEAKGSPLPPGLMLNTATGEIVGAPECIGTWQFTVTLTDSCRTPHSAQRAFSITVKPPEIGVLPGGRVGEQYSCSLSPYHVPRGGNVPALWRWEIVTGSLPAGLFLRRGAIVGTPSQPGDFYFTVKVTKRAFLRRATYETQLYTLRVVRVPDLDGDGMDDEWEMRYFGNLSANPEDDADGDGYLNITEFVLDTDPVVGEPGPPYLTGLEWTALGHGGGGAFFSPVIAPDRPELMYVSCDMGGVYRSTDAGRTWTLYHSDNIESATVSRWVREDIETTNRMSCNPVFHPFNSDIAFFGTKKGLKRTVDGGRTWQTVSDEEAGGADPPDVYNVAIDSTRPDIVCYSNDENKLFISKQSGDPGTWSLLATGAAVNIRDIFINPLSAAEDLNIVGVCGGGIYETQDAFPDAGPPLWEEITGTLRNAQITPIGEGPAQEPPPFRIDDLEGAIINNKRCLFASVRGRGLFRKIDGNDWELVKAIPAVENDMPGTQIGICQADPTRVYVGTGVEATTAADAYFQWGPGVYRSDNAGDTWHEVLSHEEAGPRVGRDWNLASNDRFGWDWGGAAHEICVCPTKKDILALSTDGWVMRSKDGGESWFFCSSRETQEGSNWWTSVGLEVTLTYGVEFAPWNHDFVFLKEADVGLWRSEDRGYSWRSSRGGIWTANSCYDVAFAIDGSQEIYAAFAQGHELPKEWRLTGQWSPDVLQGDVRVSTDSGATWQELGHPVPSDGRMGSTGTYPVTSLVLDPLAPHNLYAAVFGLGVYRYDGSTWTAINDGLDLDTNPNAWMLKAADDGTIFCAVTLKKVGPWAYISGGLYRLVPGRTRWEKVNTSQELPYIIGFHVDTTDRDVIYVATSDLVVNDTSPDDSGIWKTTDGGATWQPLFVGDVCNVAVDPQRPSRLFALQGKWARGNTPAGINISEDGGVNWRRIHSFPFGGEGLSCVNFDPDDPRIVYVGSNGGGTWRTEIPYVVAPQAGFGCASSLSWARVMEFTDNSVGDICTRYWDFGDDSFVLNEADPVHRYVSAGTYTVKLIVQGPGGTDTIERQLLIP